VATPTRIDNTHSTEWEPVPRQADQVSSVLVDIGSVLNNLTLYARMRFKEVESMFNISVGSNNAMKGDFIQC
jgi:hypothetical protein